MNLGLIFGEEVLLKAVVTLDVIAEDSKVDSKNVGPGNISKAQKL